MERLFITAQTASATETELCGKQLAQIMCQNSALPPFVALYGDLGVGKTAFVRGFTSEIAPAALVRSPTFALVNEYRGKEKTLFHFDMYRITGEDDLYSIGYDDYLARDGFALCEWSENIPEDIPEDAVRVTIERTDGADGRRITLEENE